MSYDDKQKELIDLIPLDPSWDYDNDFGKLEPKPTELEYTQIFADSVLLVLTSKFSLIHLY